MSQSTEHYECPRCGFVRRPPAPNFWPEQNDHEEIGPIGDGTPHARMHWFWDRMQQHQDLLYELVGYSPVMNRRFEDAIAEAFDKLAAEHYEHVDPRIEPVARALFDNEYEGDPLWDERPNKHDFYRQRAQHILAIADGIA